MSISDSLKPTAHFYVHLARRKVGIRMIFLVHGSAHRLLAHVGDEFGELVRRALFRQKENHLKQQVVG